MSFDDRNFDVFIGGAGVVGLALAATLRQTLGDSFRVAVADPHLVPHGADPRALAVIPAARRLLAALGAWDSLAADAQPIRAMAVTDSRLTDVMRPVFLTFATEPAEDGEPLAHMVEFAPLIATLLEQARAAGVTLLDTAVKDARTAPEETTLLLSDGNAVSARLVVAADGARSPLRERSGIATHGWTYPQSAIVTTVQHERDHDGRANEHFLPAGPFATLPLTGRRSSIVWTEQAAEAQRIVALADGEFHAELEQRFGLELGEISAPGPRRAYRLEFAMARSFITDRLALIGDAAHVIHPLAGQGANMGLKDVAALAEVIVDAARLGLDPGSIAVLERYQRWRRFDTMAMGAATDGLNRLFSNRSDLLRLARDVGLGLVDRMPVLKHGFMREAAGSGGDVPKLLRGEAL